MKTEKEIKEKLSKQIKHIKRLERAIHNQEDFVKTLSEEIVLSFIAVLKDELKVLKWVLDINDEAPELSS